MEVRCSEHRTFPPSTDTPAPTAASDAPITAAERFERERFRQALWGGWYAFLISPDRGNSEQVVNYLCEAGWNHFRAERDADAKAIVALLANPSLADAISEFVCPYCKSADYHAMAIRHKPQCATVIHIKAIDAARERAKR